MVMVPRPDPSFRPTGEIPNARAGAAAKIPPLAKRSGYLLLAAEIASQVVNIISPT
jgi:hypothetical protein